VWRDILARGSPPAIGSPPCPRCVDEILVGRCSRQDDAVLRQQSTGTYACAHTASFSICPNRTHPHGLRVVHAVRCPSEQQQPTCSATHDQLLRVIGRVRYDVPMRFAAGTHSGCSKAAAGPHEPGMLFPRRSSAHVVSGWS